MLKIGHTMTIVSSIVPTGSEYELKRLIKRICLLPHDYHLSYKEAVVRSGFEQPSLKLAGERLRWTGHVLRAEEPVLREVLTFVPEGGSRGRGHPPTEIL